MVVKGSGSPLVLVPGIQGRWEWMAPAVDALARRFRVIAFSLGGEPGAPGPRRTNGSSRGLEFGDYVEQVEQALEIAGVERAIVCGVSYGGLVAVRFAATHPRKTSALVLVSAPGPAWRPEGRVRRYVASPWLSAPGFLLTAPARLRREIAAARPGRWDRSATLVRYLWAILRHPTTPARMARRARQIEALDFMADAKAVVAPTLVITGEPDLDRVVPVAATREYLSLIPGSTGRTLGRTGHIGLVTRPEVFASLISDFAASLAGAAALAARPGDA